MLVWMGGVGHFELRVQNFKLSEWVDELGDRSDRVNFVVGVFECGFDPRDAGFISDSGELIEVIFSAESEKTKRSRYRGYQERRKSHNRQGRARVW